MKRIKFAVLACALAVMALSSTTAAFQGKNLDFKLINKTGLQISELYLSTSDDDKWGEDVLGRDVLKNGEDVDITFSSGETKCMWDLKIVDSDEDDVIWTKINLCEASVITLNYKGGKPTAIIK
ncbi:MAG: hypothetical protein M3R55_09025 [Acidobacteriota bacterium]|nr:hypothetical protein [Acidobacteriota bacterium]